MNICPECGAAVTSTLPYCSKCGAALMNGRVPNDIDIEDLPRRLRPLSAWAYFGYSLLLAIPVVGFILLFVFSFGKKRNVNLKRYARSHFCYFILFAIAIIVFAALGGITMIGEFLQMM
ncbi:MAG: zinc ribbon domain-containing protein [Christensenellaceae bacterium]|nr:zinc ribbon domain-containing protein [Christensenellaceae bacterium]